MGLCYNEKAVAGQEINQEVWYDTNTYPWLLP